MDQNRLMKWLVVFSDIDVDMSMGAERSIVGWQRKEIEMI